MVRRDEKEVNSQLQQCSIGIGVAKLLLALLLKICFKSTDSLGVVPLKAIDDVGDVVGPLGRVLAVHHVGARGVNGEEVRVCSRREDGDGGAEGSFRRFV